MTADEDVEERALRFEDTALYLRTTLRVFPDSVGTVLWYADGPVPCEETGLSRALVSALGDWEREYDEATSSHLVWPSPEQERSHAERGIALARALSEEIGNVVDVEVDDLGGAKLRISSPGSGSNPAAAAALVRMRRAAEDEDARSAARIRSGVRFRIVPSSRPPN